jgi:hypothetical protein
MNKDNLNISKIETYLNSILDGVVSNNTFFTTYPNVAIVKSSDWQDMVLVDIPSGISDMDAMGRGTIFIGLYARPLESGKKNVKKMSELERRLNEVLATASNSQYMLLRSDVHSTYDDDIDWHCNVVELTITIL